MCEKYLHLNRFASFEIFCVLFMHFRKKGLFLCKFEDSISDNNNSFAFKKFHFFSDFFEELELICTFYDKSLKNILSYFTANFNISTGKLFSLC